MSHSEHGIGFMQGRLSEPINGRIQTFPAGHWEEEFLIAKEHQLSIMEWTIDTLTFSQNPLVRPSEITKIRTLSQINGVKIPSVTCDYYMENPHWKSQSTDIQTDLIKIIKAMSLIGAQVLVIPLVDNSSISRNPAIDLNFFRDFRRVLTENNVQIAFEVDLDVEAATDFIQLFEPENFGINYDIGNSASLGFTPQAEISSYGNRIINVHVKDRLFRGGTVRLGQGAADFKTVLLKLREFGYQRNYIFQTARAIDGNHVGELLTNIEFFTGISIDE
jgi:hexulose-6-phosphate isomerase